MISLENAVQLAIENAQLTDIEKISFLDALQRVLAEDITSDDDYPSFNKSAMDGYALCKCDADKPLKIVQTVQAGERPIKQLKQGECVKIMTGARLPDNADYVAKIEDTYINDKGLVVIKRIENKSNIRFAGEDIHKGEIILKKGTLIRPQEIASLATVGKTEVSVYKQPTIAVASTGNELIEPTLIPNDVQIRNSNAYQIIAQCNQIGIKAKYCGIIKDTLEDTITHIEKMLTHSDVIILSGGVSMGNFDFVPQALDKLGFKKIFHNIAVQPGKPTLMGRKNKQYFFGLPGNPVSSFMQFELIVKPFIFKLMGHEYKARTAFLPLNDDYKRKKAERTSLIPVVIKENKVIPVEYHGSAHLFAMNTADGFIEIPQNTTLLPKNTYVTVRLF
ncbi:MAG: molybdopterin molybdotransferase MoeA [Bacteroidales bacterium]